MNVQDFTYLLQHPDASVSQEQTKQLEDILTTYPYFQAARAVHLKGLKNSNSFKYNNALKIAAAYTTDRDILFDFITSEEFLQNDIAATISEKDTPLDETDNPDEIIPEKNIAMIEASDDPPLPKDVTDADQILDPKLFRSKDPEVDKQIIQAKEKAAKELELGQPLSFTKKERYSFTEWLQLTSNKTIKRAEEPIEKETDSSQQKEILRKEKFERINKFIAESPKIVPKENSTTKIDPKQHSKFDKEELMTETLARVYLEQKKYKKAIQAYKILSLKYPEKSGFFADRIKAAEKIQQENKNL